MADFNERLAKTQEKFEAAKAKINRANEKAKEAVKMGMAELEASFDELAVEMDELDAALMEQAKSDEAAFIEAGDKLNEDVEDKFATAHGDVMAVQENARLAKEKREAKISSLRLRAQMNVNAAKAKISEKKESYDKAMQEERIAEMLDYADSCRVLAVAMALEAELAMLNAAAEVADYNKKYNNAQ